MLRGAQGSAQPILRFLFVTHFFPPEELSASFLAFEFARALVERGHDVDVLTGYPNWPEGRVFAGYARNGFTTQALDGIHVHRVPFLASPNGNFLQRACDFKSFEWLVWLRGR